MSGLLIAMTAFSGATAAASLAGAITGFIRVKNYNDPARRGLKWVAPALMCLFLGTLLYLAQSILNFVVTNNYYGFVSGRTSFHLGVMANFFVYLATIALFLALIETSFGILTMWNRAPKRIAGMRITVWVVVGLMLLLDLAYMIGSLVFARFSRSTYSGVFGIVSLTLEALLFVAFCWVLGILILIAKRAKARRQSEGLQGSESILPLYYASASVALFGSIWFLVYIIASVTVRPRYGYQTYDPLVVISVVITIISYIVPLISLILLVVLGMRQHGGLWTVGSAIPKAVEDQAVPHQYGVV